MKKKYIKKLMISGLSVTTNYANETSEDNQKITNLWEEYETQDIFKKTHNKENSASIYGVYTNYVDQDKSDYDVTVGVEVTKPKNVIIIENQKFLMFTKQGDVTEVVYTLWEEIWEYFKENTEYEIYTGWLQYMIIRPYCCGTGNYMAQCYHLFLY